MIFLRKFESLNIIFVLLQLLVYVFNLTKAQTAVAIIY